MLGTRKPVGNNYEVTYYSEVETCYQCDIMCNFMYNAIDVAWRRFSALMS